eukprot:3938462-Rhodomonas_salina.2
MSQPLEQQSHVTAVWYKVRSRHSRRAITSHACLRDRRVVCHVTDGGSPMLVPDSAYARLCQYRTLRRLTRCEWS